MVCFLFRRISILFHFRTRGGISSSSLISAYMARAIPSSLIPSLRFIVGPNFFFFILMWGCLAKIDGAGTISRLISAMGEAVHAIDTPLVEEHSFRLSNVGPFDKRPEQLVVTLQELPLPTNRTFATVARPFPLSSEMITTS